MIDNVSSRPLLKYCKYIKVHVERSVSRVWKVYLKNYTSGLDEAGFEVSYVKVCAHSGE